MSDISPEVPSLPSAETGSATGDSPPLKTYSVLYAEDIPHYGSADIEARSDAEALRLARSFDTNQVSYYEGCWDGAMCKRIVSIEDPAGKTVANDIPLDDYRLHLGIDAQDHKASVTVDNRFRLTISRSAPPQITCAQLIIKVYPITDGQAWDAPYDTFVVDEGRVIELENEAREVKP